MLDKQEPWKEVASVLDRIRAEVAVLPDQLRSDLPPGDRTRGFLAYVLAAEKCLEGAGLFAEGKDFSAQQPKYAIDEFKAVADLLGQAGLAAASIEQDTDVAQTQSLPPDEWKLVRAIGDLMLLQDGSASSGLERVTASGPFRNEHETSGGRMKIWAVYKNRSGVVVNVAWWIEPGMDVDRVCRALEQYLRAAADPHVSYPEAPAALNPVEVTEIPVEAKSADPSNWDEWTPEKESIDEIGRSIAKLREQVYIRRPAESRRRMLLGELLEAREILIRAVMFAAAGPAKDQDPEAQDHWARMLASKDEAWRAFYEAHPYSETSPIEIPPADAWEEKPENFFTAGEFRLSLSLDPCKSWSAMLSRKTYIGNMPAPHVGVVHALVLSKVSGSSTKEKAKEAVVAAARVAGWVK